MKIAKTTNIALANAAMGQLINRQDGLPGLGVLYGPSGYGKATATVAVANSTRAYYVQLRSAWTRKAFMEKVCIELGVEKGRNTAECLDNICERLAAAQRPLIIDEADYLVTKTGMVELVRDIYEGSQSPILLVGEELLPVKLKRYERFHGRVLSWIPAQPVNKADAQALAQVYAPTVKIADEVFDKLLAISYGSVRRVAVNLVNLAELADTQGWDEITLQALKTAKNFDFYSGEAPARRRS